MTVGKHAWCQVCHHMLVPGRAGWIHASDDDWSGTTTYCPCVGNMRGCVPEPARRLKSFFGGLRSSLEHTSTAMRTPYGITPPRLD